MRILFLTLFLTACAGEKKVHTDMARACGANDYSITKEEFASCYLELMKGNK